MSNMTRAQRAQCRTIIHGASLSAGAVGAGLAQFPGSDKNDCADREGSPDGGSDIRNHSTKGGLCRTDQCKNGNRDSKSSGESNSRCSESGDCRNQSSDQRHCCRRVGGAGDPDRGNPFGRGAESLGK